MTFRICSRGIAGSLFLIAFTFPTVADTISMALSIPLPSRVRTYWSTLSSNQWLNVLVLAVSRGFHFHCLQQIACSLVRTYSMNNNPSDSGVSKASLNQIYGPFIAPLQPTNKPSISISFPNNMSCKSMKQCTVQCYFPSIDHL